MVYMKTIRLRNIAKLIMCRDVISGMGPLIRVSGRTMPEYNTVYTSQSSRCVYRSLGGGGAGRGGAKYQISGAEKCQNPFGGNLDTGASPYQPY